MGKEVKSNICRLVKPMTNLKRELKEIRFLQINSFKESGRKGVKYVEADRGFWQNDH